MATQKKRASGAPAEPEATTTYTVISPLHHGVLVDGEAIETRYEPGETVDLTEAEAAPLLGHTVKEQDAAAKSAG